jgi:predicted RNA-binding Zn-ribbon protein involved in translation (DUF1610 family)
MAEKAKTADRAKKAELADTPPCPQCGKATRIVKRMKNRSMGISGGMYLSCSVCDFAQKR